MNVSSYEYYNWECDKQNFFKFINVYFKSKNAKLIVYYAPREEKLGQSCKLPRELKARLANTRCGLENFSPV